MLKRGAGGVDDGGIELRSGPGLELGQRLLAGHRRPVGPVARHRVERVADGDDARLERDVLAGQPIRIPVAVDSLVGRAHEPRHAAQDRCRCEDVLADGGMPPHDLPFGLVERAGLLEDPPRHHGLADVVQLGREHDVFDPLTAQPEPVAHRAGEIRHPVRVRSQVGRVLVEHREQQVAGLALGRRPPAVLLGVHPLVDDPKRRRRVARLARQERETVGRADVCVLVGKRLERRRQRPLELRRRAVEQDAELVAAEAVGGAGAGEGRREPGAELREERIAGGMPVGVVIGLEAIEVEHRQGRRRVIRALADRALEVAEEAAPVPEAGQVVGQCELPALLDPRPHGAEPEPEPRGGCDQEPRLAGGHAEGQRAEQRCEARRHGQQEKKRAPRPAAQESRKRVHGFVIGRTCSSFDGSGYVLPPSP